MNTQKNQFKDAASLLLLLMLGVWGASNLKAMGDEGQSEQVVKKNADGSVDVFDKPSSRAANASTGNVTKGGGAAQRSEGAQQVNVHYRLRPGTGTRHISGVNVRTNPDGSIETFDTESPTPVHTVRSSKATAKHK